MISARAFLLCMAFGSLAALRASGLRLVTSPSVPMGVYATEGVPPSRMRVGGYALLEPESPHAPSLLRDGVRAGEFPRTWADGLMKRVAAREGDVIALVDGALAVNGAPLSHSRLRETDSTGRALPRPAFPVVLRRGEVWLASEHDDGFDSRYFGPVDERATSAVGRPLWTW
jgi:conjugative transfer signal peptidase TraF